MFDDDDKNVRWQERKQAHEHGHLLAAFGLCFLRAEVRL